MASRKNVLVIGLGRFGSSLACALVDSGHDVLGVDSDPAVVQKFSTQLTHVIVLDATNEEALSSLGINNFDATVVASGGNFESSILITLLLKRLGARMVVAKAVTAQQAEVLHKLNVDRVVQPEHDAGLRLARQLIAPDILDFITLEPGLSIVEVLAPDFTVNKTLAELDLRNRYKIAILVIKGGNRVIISPDSSDRIRAEDMLVVIGRDEDIARMQK
ncbi:MAG: TrkA family potassium uptake protein [Chloroflexota bacterium]|jgi:trk system potassium uptake protein TrkA